MEAEALALVMQQKYRILLLEAYSLLRNIPDAEDAVQNAFLKAWLNRDSLRNESYAGTWMRRIVRNESIDMIRRQQAAKRKIQTKLSVSEQIAEEDLLLSSMAAESMLAVLTDHQSRITKLYYLQGYSTREIAHMLGKSKGTICSVLSYSRNRLRATKQP